MGWLVMVVTALAVGFSYIALMHHQTAAGIKILLMLIPVLGTPAAAAYWYYRKGRASLWYMIPSLALWLVLLMSLILLAGLVTAI
ncbi:MAG: hypothetical protein ACYDEY_12715 [Acidimicrobiales bacterium]